MDIMINSVSSIVGQYNRVQATAPRQQVQREQAADRVELSDEAQIFSEAFAAAKRTMQQPAGGWEARVEQLRSRVQSGAYSVDISAVCESLLG